MDTKQNIKTDIQNNITKELNFSLFAGFKLFKKNWSKIITASLISWGISACFIFLLPPFGFFLSFISLSILCIGLERYNICILENKEKSFETIFSYIKITPTAFILKFTKYLYILFWSIFLLIPGIISALNYAFSSFILADNPKLTSEEVLLKSKEYTKGFRSQILLIFLFCIFMISIGISMSGGICLFLHYILYIDKMVCLVIFSILTIILLITLIIPYWKISLTNYYILSKKQHILSKKLKSKA